MAFDYTDGGSGSKSARSAIHACGCPFGSLLRAMHHWSANLLIVTAFLHLVRVFLTGGFKRGRGGNWLLGLVLLLMVVAFNFTGYLLPWDQLVWASPWSGRRPNSTMPAFGDRMTSVEIDAVVQYLRSWEPTAPQVANPRGNGQGGGPPWQRATPDPNNPIDPGQGGGPPAGRGRNRAQSTLEAGQAPVAEQPPALTLHSLVANSRNKLAVRDGST